MMAECSGVWIRLSRASTSAEGSVDRPARTGIAPPSHLNLTAFIKASFLFAAFITSFMRLHSLSCRRRPALLWDAVTAPLGFTLPPASSSPENACLTITAPDRQLRLSSSMPSSLSPFTLRLLRAGSASELHPRHALSARSRSATLAALNQSTRSLAWLDGTSSPTAQLRRGCRGRERPRLWERPTRIQRFAGEADEASPGVHLAPPTFSPLHS